MAYLRNCLVVCLALSSLFTCACSSKPLCNPDGTPSAASYAAHGETPSETEAIAFALALEKCVKENDTNGVNNLISWDTLLDFATEGVSASYGDRAAFVRSVKAKATSDDGLAGELTKRVAGGGSCKFLRCHEEDGQMRVWFRLLRNTAALNYYDMTLLKYNDGKVRAADFYSMVTGEFKSHTLRGVFTSVAANASQNFLNQASEHDRDLAKSITSLQSMLADIKSGQPADALEIYDRLPASIKGDKTFLVARLEAALAMMPSDDHKAYNAVLDDFRRYHPGDPCLDLLNIDHYFALKQYDKALAAINCLDNALGGDEYLNLYRANVYLLQKEYNKCLQAARRATDAEKNLQSAYRVQLIAAANLKQYDEVVRLLNILRHDFKVDTAGVLSKPLYKPFLATSEYKTWKRDQDSVLDPPANP